MIFFAHDNPSVGTLTLRLSPTLVEWTYNLNTAVTDTYGGQVIQLLSVNFENLIIEGQFGKEGPHGAVSPGVQRPVDEYRDLSQQGGLKVGLTQMTEYFQRYFAIASQGHSADAVGRYDQRPMRISYDGSLDQEEGVWQVYPITFPSYKRANEEFAPKWRVEFQVYEAPIQIQTIAMEENIDKLRAAVGYTPMNPFSDPLGQILPADPQKRTAKAIADAQAQADSLNGLITDHYSNLLPAYTATDLNELIFFGGSLPNIWNSALPENNPSTRPNDRSGILGP